jgi:hypothetical protein
MIWKIWKISVLVIVTPKKTSSFSCLPPPPPGAAAATTATASPSSSAFFNFFFKYGKMKCFYSVTQVTLDFKRFDLKKYRKKVVVLSDVYVNV